MTGLAPEAPLKMVLWEGVLLKDAQGLTVEWDRVNRYCEKLAKALDRVHQEVKDLDEQRRRQRAAKNANAKFAMRFEEGDYVMVAAWG